MTKSELRQMIREMLHEELAAQKRFKLKEAPVRLSSKKPVYVLTTFDNKELFYDDFEEAVIDAEGDLFAEANMINSMYKLPNGNLVDMPESDPYYGRWTEEEGIRTTPRA